MKLGLLVWTYGYSLKGMRAILRVGGRRINAIGVMNMQGMEDAYIVEVNVNGDVFERFVTRSLVPILKPFNGINSHSVDNVSIRHLDKIAEMIAGTCSLLRFLPPYSPELNPIEHVFSKVKAFLKANDTVCLNTRFPTTLVTMAFCTITQNECINYIRHSGYTY